MKYLFIIIISLLVIAILIFVGKGMVKKNRNRSLYETNICGKYIIDFNKSVLYREGIISDTFALQFNPDHTFRFNIDSDYISAIDGKWRHKIAMDISYNELIFRNQLRQQFELDGKSLIIDYPIAKLGTKYVERLVFNKIEDCAVKVIN